MIIYNTSELRNTICFSNSFLDIYSGDERLDLGSVLVEANFPCGTASQRHYPSLGTGLCVDCEQSLFFFRFSKGSAHARALSGEAARRKKRGRQPECLSRLAPSVKRLVICVSRAFYSTDQEKRETARSLVSVILHQLISMKRSRRNR